MIYVILIIVTNTGNDANQYNRKVSLKNFTPFFNYTLKVNSQLIEDAQDLDIVMPIYNLLYYSKNFRKNNRVFLELLPRYAKFRI